MPASSTIHLSRRRGWLLVCAVAGFAFLAATLVPVHTTTAQGVPAIDIQAATDGISVDFFATTPRNVLTFSVRVVGPGRFVFEQRVEDTVLQWIPPDDLADGFYHWEAWVVSADVGAQMRNLTPALEARTADHWFDEEFRQTHIATGSFKVGNGLLGIHHGPRLQEDSTRTLPQRVAGAILDFLVPSARAAEEGLSNNFFGTDAGANDEGDNDNSFFGGEAGRDNTTGVDNAFFGRSAGVSNISGNSNSFFGNSAGFSNTTASENSFFGGFAGFSNTTGSQNSFFGSTAGDANTTGNNNSFFGSGAGNANTEGHSNSFFGRLAGRDNTTGFDNSFFGSGAGNANTEGHSNSFFGQEAGSSNTEGFDNSFFGHEAGINNTTGNSNSFFGRRAGSSNTTGSFNSFFGYSAGLSNTEGNNNSFFGRRAGFNNTTGLRNSFFGFDAGLNNTTGTSNAFFGRSAGENNTEGEINSFFGNRAGLSNTTGCCNSFFGDDAGILNTTGEKNAFFGSSAGLSNSIEHNNTFIGADSNGAAGITNATALGHRAQVTQSDSLVLGSINGVNDATANVDVGIGISAPAAPLHVRRFDNTAEVRVQDTGATDPGPGQTMFNLINNGPTKFRMEDTSQADVRWEFRTSGTQGSNERFQVNKIGSGVIEAQFLAGGDLTIAGNLFQASSRAVKERIIELEPEAVLARLDALSVHEWSYKRTPDERHLGPMAEDFHAVFGLGGSTKHIAPGDLAGVALAAAKALHEQVEIRDRRITALESKSAVLGAENAELRERLERLEAKFLSNM